MQSKKDVKSKDILTIDKSYKIVVSNFYTQTLKQKQNLNLFEKARYVLCFRLSKQKNSVTSPVSQNNATFNMHQLVIYSIWSKSQSHLVVLRKTGRCISELQKQQTCPTDSDVIMLHCYPNSSIAPLLVGI